MACDCNKQNYDCPGNNTSTNCVLWSGPSYPALGICTGDPVTYLEQIILDKITDITNTITKPLNINLATCDMMLKAMQGKDKTIENLLQVLLDNQCTLRDMINKVESEIPPISNYSFNLKCVTPAGAATDTNAIIQGLIDKVCALQTQVDGISPSVETIVNDKVVAILESALKGLGGRGIVKSGTGISTVFTFTAFIPPFVPVPYYGPLSNFDGNGKGLVGTPYEGWIMCTGVPGMPDFRGRTLVSSVSGIPGPALDPAVDPSSGANPGCNYTTGDKFGENFHTNTIAEIPSHTHSVIDPGHSHSYQYPANESFSGSKFNSAKHDDSETRTTGSSFTGISIGSTGGGTPHNNRQPSIAVTAYIMLIV